MSSDARNDDGPREAGAPKEDIPPIEDAYEADESVEPAVVEDDFSVPDQTATEAGTGSGGNNGETAALDVEPSLGPATVPAVANGDSDTDTGALPAEPAERRAGEEPEGQIDWNREESAHRIVVELKRIEARVREILEGRDPRRKRKLGGTRRWQDLEEELVTWHDTARFDRPTLARLRELITRRHYLFRRLRFLAGTHGTWNS
jgi:hypothetical protein